MTTVNKALLIYPPKGESLLKAIDEAARELGCELLPVPIESFLGDPRSHLIQAAQVVALLEGTELTLVMKETQRQGLTIRLLPLHWETKEVSLSVEKRLLTEYLMLQLTSIIVLGIGAQ